ncbi:MAG: hypothetical protein ACTSUR_05460 [Candidatus Heimdallarchaeaceae archaeon]
MKAIIHLEENLDVKVDSSGNITSKESNGVLKIINNSEKTTLWGIELKYDKEEDVESIDEKPIPHIEPKSHHIISYKTEVSPKLEIKEIVDTSYNGEEVNHKNKDLVFSVEQTLAFEITITNNYPFSLKNITVEKQLPQDTKELRAIEPFPGDVNILENEKVVNWIIPELSAGTSASIIISSTCIPTNVQPYKMGEIIIKCELDNILSTLKPFLDGDCDNVDLGMELVEKTTPNQWQIKLGLRNASEFEILLKNVKIESNGEEAYFKDLNVELESAVDEPIWNESIIIESEKVPEITKKFDYSVLYDITEHSIINYEQASRTVYVVKTSASKFFEPSEVTTYAITDLISTIDITNTGSATIGMIEIEDTIPSYVEVVEVKGETTEKILEVDFVERPKPKPKPVIEEREMATFEQIEHVEEEVKEEDYVDITQEDITTTRTYHYILKDLNLKPGQITKVKVICKAQKPRSEGSHPSPSTIKAYATNPTKPYICDALAEGREPALIINFKQRSYKVTSIFTKQLNNSYNIEIPIVNTGDVPLDNVIVLQPVFTAEYVSHTPPTVDVTVETSTIKCYIKRINVGETITINLNIRTDGPLRQQQATIRIDE